MTTTIYQKFISRYAETFTLIDMTDGDDYIHSEIVPAAVVAKLSQEEYDDLFNELLDSNYEKVSWSDGEDEIDHSCDKLYIAMKKFLEKFGCGMEQRIAQVQADKERLEKIQEIIKTEQSPLQEYVNENILSALDAQKVANLICQQMTLVSLVKDMRKAQEDVDTFLDFGNVPECYFDRKSKLEDKVDDLLKSMEE